ncbi:MAG: hypothetical protein ABSH22_00520 [Tepidisphaeraceae bacterium]|jgi:hypothetical protein
MARITAILGLVLLTLSFAPTARAADGKYRNFRVAIYVTRDTVAQWSNPQVLALAYDNMSRQLKFDKVYLEIAAGKSVIREETIDPIKKFFTDRGIEVSAATAPNGNSGYNGANSQGGSLSFALQADRDYLTSVGQLAARHFDELILDDWFFSAGKTAADIAAKGDKTWTQYRMAAFDDAAANLLIKPAKAINPNMRLIIKFPNWYEHYQGLGYDLEVEPKIFDAIYTGVETRDPIAVDWEQHLQQYESYDILRYLENVKPGGNAGGWVDTLGTQYIDRYPEQIWDMAFAKPREITLWQWNDALKTISVGTRPWQDQPTSFDYQKMLASYQPPSGAAATAPDAAAPNPGGGRRGGNSGPINDARNGRVAGYAMEQVDAFLDKLGNPIGIPAYRPPHAIGEEFYHDFLGMVGIPIDLHATFPADSNSPVILLTEGAKNDPDIVKEMKAALGAGKNVVITSGLLRALQGKGIEDISEFEVTDQKAAVTNFLIGNGQVLPNSHVDTPILFPIIHLLTNQSWATVNGFSDEAPANAYPIVLRDAYDRGFLYVLVLPDNIADLYRIPTPALNVIRSEIMGTFPTRLVDAPAQVSLFVYDNNTFVVQSFLDQGMTVGVSVAGNPNSITDLLSDQSIMPDAAPRGGRGGGRRGRGPAARRFSIVIPPHSFRAFSSQTAAGGQ